MKNLLSSLKARLSNATPAESFGSFPVISTPSLGHEHVREVCRIHSAIPVDGIMTTSRLHLPGPTHGRISIIFLPAQHVKRRFGQVSRHCTHRFAVSFAPS